MNSFWILWIGQLCRARSELARWAVSAILEKLPFVIKPYFLLFEARISCVFQIFLLRGIKAYLCPNMINSDAVDFSERRPEEVISFFWRSVYFSLYALIVRSTVAYLCLKIINFDAVDFFWVSVLKKQCCYLWHSVLVGPKKGCEWV